MSYLVLACKSCGTPRVVQADKQSAECHRCGTTTRVEGGRVHARTNSLEAAQDAVGQVNAQRAGGELVRPDGAGTAVEGDSDDEGDVEPRDAIDRALVSARTVSSQRQRVQLAAEGLTDELDTFDEDDWIEAMSRLDVDEPRAREHLRRLSQASVVAEPELGHYRYVG